MKLKNLTTLLTNTLGTPVNQSMLALSLGITRQTISNRIKNDSELTVSELSKIEKYFNVNLTNQAKGLSSDEIVIDYYPDVFASCGNGAIVFSEEKESRALCSEIYPLPENHVKRVEPVFSDKELLLK